MNQVPKFARRSRQAGFSVLSVLLALALGAVIVAGQIQAQILQAELNAGKMQGEMLNVLKGAANQYTNDNTALLQLDQPVGTLVPGSNPGETLSPSIQNLIDLNYLPAQTSALARINNGTYRFQITKVPVGCVAAACNLQGLLFIDEPVVRPGTTTMAATKIGALIDAVGADVMVSLTGASPPTTLIGANGSTLPNPLVNREGVVGTRFAWGSSGFGPYLVVNDSRDPNFQGNFTLRGNAEIKGTTRLVGAVTADAELKAERLVPTGVYAPGSGCPATEPGAIARSSDAANGGALVVCSGSVWTSLGSIAVAGGACSIEAASATDSTTGRELTCFRNSDGVTRWAPMSDFLKPSIAGATGCIPGQVAYTLSAPGAQSTALVCNVSPSTGGTRFVRLQDVTSNLVLLQTFGVTDGTVVPVPDPAYCSGMFVINIVPQTESSQDAGFTRGASWNGAGWNVLLRNGNGAALNNATTPPAAIAQVFCQYL